MLSNVPNAKYIPILIDKWYLRLLPQRTKTCLKLLDGLALEFLNLLVTAPNVSYCESDVHRFNTSQVGLC